ncbi:hypothetical protein Ga0080574_TMP251 (plasmid) [Salipiger abyssi]|uniref:Uncharacterized protein n=1 Tax=Salipiger abyssi TaxID=1250539 RepID=A0A1P8UMK4_9RHOB|nr:hypothetical protein Ga0080574_TMP251 [Salipiger abyssi]
MHLPRHVRSFRLVPKSQSETSAGRVPICEGRLYICLDPIFRQEK